MSTLSKEPSPDGNRWFRISERQLYFLEQLAEQYGAMCQSLQPGSALSPVPDGISYVGLREEIRQQLIDRDFPLCEICGHDEFHEVHESGDPDPGYCCKKCEHIYW